MPYHENVTNLQGVRCPILKFSQQLTHKQAQASGPSEMVLPNDSSYAMAPPPKKQTTFTYPCDLCIKTNAHCWHQHSTHSTACLGCALRRTKCNASDVCKQPPILDILVDQSGQEKMPKKSKSKGPGLELYKAALAATESEYDGIHLSCRLLSYGNKQALLTLGLRAMAIS